MCKSVNFENNYFLLAINSKLKFKFKIIYFVFLIINLKNTIEIERKNTIFFIIVLDKSLSCFYVFSGARENSKLRILKIVKK